MTISRIKGRFGRSAVSLAGAVALTMAASTSSDARAHKAAGLKTALAMATAQVAPAPQSKPIRLRYFGGPKSAMSAQ
jgi:hypothetical protein